jgi:hypothetical protein
VFAQRRVRTADLVQRRGGAEQGLGRDADGREVRDDAEMRRNPEALRMRDPVPVDHRQVRRLREHAEHAQQGGHRLEGQETRHVGRRVRHVRDLRVDQVERVRIQDDRDRTGARAVVFGRGDETTDRAQRPGEAVAQRDLLRERSLEMRACAMVPSHWGVWCPCGEHSA